MGPGVTVVKACADSDPLRFVLFPAAAPEWRRGPWGLLPGAWWDRLAGQGFCGLRLRCVRQAWEIESST